MERNQNIARAWMIYQHGKPQLYTLRQYKPEAWDAWYKQVRPISGFECGATAKRVRLIVER